MNNKGQLDYMKEFKKPFVSESVKENILQTNEHCVFRKVYLKYLIMKVRAKISFIALEKRMTVIQLLVDTILRCYRHLMNKGAIKRYSNEEELRHETAFFDMANGVMNGFTLQIA